MEDLDRLTSGVDLGLPSVGCRQEAEACIATATLRKVDIEENNNQAAFKRSPRGSVFISRHYCYDI